MNLEKIMEAYIIMISLPTEQRDGLERLLEHFDEREMKVEGWDLCDGGCCLKLWCKGYDEIVWGIDVEGQVYKNDRYGNHQDLEI